MNKIIEAEKVEKTEPVSSEVAADAPVQKQSSLNLPKEIGGPKGPEPTRYNDWEVKGICSDF